MTGNRPQDSGERRDQDLKSVVETATSSAPSRSFWLGAALGTVLAVATVLLIVQNGESVLLHWLMLDFTAPLWLFLLASALSGAVLALLGAALGRRARTHARHRQEAAQSLRKLVGGSTRKRGQGQTQS